MSAVEGAVIETPAKQYIKEWQVAYDIVFVININSKGWILEKICRVIAEQSSRNYKFIFSERNDKITTALPAARAYFFAHYALYVNAVKREPLAAAGLRYVWFTHPATETQAAFDELVAALKQATIVFTANTGHQRMLIEAGVDEKTVMTVLGGADSDAFTGKPRGNGVIGFVTAYYERKNPDAMLELMRLMPDQAFCLVGPSPDEVENTGLLWRNWERYDELRSLSNLRLYEAKYAEYPEIFKSIDVYVSLSRLEGGPIPLIEAMQANAVPVVTRTGFAEDVVTDGKNGFLVDIDFKIDQVVAAVRSALALTNVDVRKSAADLTWQSFGKQISRAIFGSGKSPFTSANLADGDDRTRYCRFGFGQSDTQGIWQINKQALLVVERQERRYAVQLRIQFFIRKETTPAHVRLRFWVNGVKVSSVRYRSGREHTAELALQAGMAKGSRYNIIIAIESDDPDFEIAEGQPLIRLESFRFAWKSLPPS